MDETPSKRVKLLFWLILGSLSVFFAEVVSGSFIYPYFTVWGIFVVMPLYTLHILVLAYVVFNFGKPRFYTLFIAGAIFGMYEAYMTKVLWDPFWGDAVFHVGGVAVVEAVVLVLWWHPFWAFIIPLFVAEQVSTTSNETVNGLPSRPRELLYEKKTVLLPVLALLAGFFQSGNSPSLGDSLLSGFFAIGFLMILIYLYRTRTNGKEFTLHQLLPSKKEFRVLLALLIAQYILLGLVLRPEALPGLGPQFSIWLMYGALFVLLYRNMKRSRNIPLSEGEGLSIPISLKQGIRLAIIFAFTSAIFKAVGLGLVPMVVLWFGGGLFGIYMLFKSIKDTFAST